jgi:hypothetical protein
MSGKAGTVLLELLDYATADQLDRLLNPVSLLYLLKQRGWQDDQLRTELTSGKIPGELLLGLFKDGYKAEQLMAELDAAGLPQASAKKGSSSGSSTSSSSGSSSAFAPQTPAGENQTQEMLRNYRFTGTVYLGAGLACILANFIALYITGNTLVIVLILGPVFILAGLFELITGRQIIRH